MNRLFDQKAQISDYPKQRLQHTALVLDTLTGAHQQHPRTHTNTTAGQLPLLLLLL
jgi:hypothetical protein